MPDSRSADRLPRTGRVVTPPAAARYVRSPAAGAPMLIVLPAGASNAVPNGTSAAAPPLACTSTAAVAPAVASLAGTAQRTTARPRVSSIAAAVPSLPASRFAAARLA